MGGGACGQRSGRNQTMTPVIGKAYAWRQVTKHFHGEQTFLAKRDGRIVCATLVAAENPEAPEVMIVGTKPRNMQRAEEFCEQGGAIPVFLKHAPNEWEFRGFFEFESFTTDPRRLAKHKTWARQRLTRVPALVREKKRRHRAATGGLACEACGFDFGSRYGFPDFCEVHHRVPLAKNEVERETRLEDLAVLCSNCHRAIHRIRPKMPTVEELRWLVERQRQRHAQTR